jgi:hypothetical protein
MARGVSSKETRLATWSEWFIRAYLETRAPEYVWRCEIRNRSTSNEATREILPPATENGGKIRTYCDAKVLKVVNTKPPCRDTHHILRFGLARLARASQRLGDRPMGHRIYCLSVLCRNRGLRPPVWQHLWQPGSEQGSTPTHLLELHFGCHLSG